MSVPAIPDDDWKIITKYSEKDIGKQFLVEKSISKPRNDLFLEILVLINLLLIVTLYYLEYPTHYGFFILFSSAIIAASISIVGHMYGKTPKFQIVAILLNASIILCVLYLFVYVVNNETLNLISLFFTIMIGIMLGLLIGFTKHIIRDVVLGNPDLFSIEVLLHKDEIESYEDILENMINNVIEIRSIPEYSGDEGKIFQKRGLETVFLLYTIVDNYFSFFIFSKNGRYVYQDEYSISIQKKISFLLKNSMTFKDCDNEQQRNETSNTCLNLLNQYIAPSNLLVSMENHKISTFFAISLIFVIFMYPLYSIYIDEILQYTTDIVVPVVISAIALATANYYLMKNR